MEYSIDRLAIDSGDSLRSAMERLAETGTRVLFVVDEGRLVGSVSDGDVRRALLGGASLDGPLSVATRGDVSHATITDDVVTVHERFREGVDLLPIIDGDGRLSRVVGKPTDVFIPIAEPNLGTAESALVNECLRSNWISSAGRFVSEFEQAFEAYLGGGSAVSVSNGTLGLVLALHAMGVGPGDEVIVPDLTFGATANAVVQVGATPVLVDVDPSTWGLSAATVNDGIGPRTRAVIPVHLYGHPVEIAPIADLCRERGIALIEDCAEAIGSRIDGHHVGLAGDAGVFSFFANKTITTGEGGMVVFSDPSAAVRSRRARSHGLTPARRYWHEDWGTNFRMTNLQAALGVGQMSRVEELVARKRDIAGRYSDLIRALSKEGLELPTEQPWATSCFWLYTVLLPVGTDRDHLMHELSASGVESRPMFYPLSIQPAFADAINRLPPTPQSTRISARGLSLPSGTTLSDSGIEFVVEKFSDALAAAASRG